MSDQIPHPAAQDSTHNKFVQVHGEVDSDPVMGHGGTAFEGNDARASIVITSLAIIGGTLIVVFALTVGIHKLLEKANPQGQLPSPMAPARVVPPTPQLQVHPWEELPDVRAHEDEVLNGYGKDANGRVHIPIRQAINATPGRLAVTPNAPEGIRTPGGEGRNFAKGLNEMPAPYQKPPATIQGEIRKGGQ